jgi:hypothetical protein
LELRQRSTVNGQRECRLEDDLFPRSSYR